MSAKTLLIENVSKSDRINYGDFLGNSSNILSNWFNSLEERSSVFWLQYINYNLIDEDEEEEEIDKPKPIACPADAITTQSPDVTTAINNECVESTNYCNNINHTIVPENLPSADVKGDSNEVTKLPIVSCNSIAHRDTELLVALTENCTHGPVCYFCR